MIMSQRTPPMVCGFTSTGKSFFASWLSPKPEFFVKSLFDVSNKEVNIYLSKYWLWEDNSLDRVNPFSVFNRLRDIVKRRVVSYRPKYKRESIDKPAIASLILTGNDLDKNLNPFEKSHYFRVIKIIKIDSSYSKELDIIDVWSQNWLQVKSKKTK